LFQKAKKFAMFYCFHATQCCFCQKKATNQIFKFWQKFAKILKKIAKNAKIFKKHPTKKSKKFKKIFKKTQKFCQKAPSF